jgi:hypothetical protein
MNSEGFGRAQPRSRQQLLNALPQLAASANTPAGKSTPAPVTVLPVTARCICTAQLTGRGGANAERRIANALADGSAPRRQPCRSQVPPHSSELLRHQSSGVLYGDACAEPGCYGARDSIAVTARRRATRPPPRCAVQPPSSLAARCNGSAPHGIANRWCQTHEGREFADAVGVVRR